MKKIFVAAVSLLIAMSALNAQTVKKGSMDFLKGQTAMQVEYDFKDALVSNSMTIESYVRSKNPNEAEVTKYMAAVDQERVELMMYFIDVANRKVDQSIFGTDLKADYKMVVKLVAIDSEGRYNTTDVSFVNLSTGEEVALVEFKCTGGRFGTFTNLMGDAFKKDFTPSFIRFYRRSVR
jgi:hypothetical protein